MPFGHGGFNSVNAGNVLTSGQDGYSRAMSQLFSQEAAVTRPLCIVQPRAIAEVASTVRGLVNPMSQLQSEVEATAHFVPVMAL
jgi:hypothetical protein